MIPKKAQTTPEAQENIENLKIMGAVLQKILEGAGYGALGGGALLGGGILLNKIFNRLVGKPKKLMDIVPPEIPLQEKKSSFKLPSEYTWLNPVLKALGMPLGAYGVYKLYDLYMKKKETDEIQEKLKILQEQLNKKSSFILDTMADMGVGLKKEAVMSQEKQIFKLLKNIYKQVQKTHKQLGKTDVLPSFEKIFPWGTHPKHSTILKALRYLWGLSGREKAYLKDVMGASKLPIPRTFSLGPLSLRNAVIYGVVPSYAAKISGFTKGKSWNPISVMGETYGTLVKKVGQGAQQGVQTVAKNLISDETQQSLKKFFYNNWKKIALGIGLLGGSTAVLGYLLTDEYLKEKEKQKEKTLTKPTIPTLKLAKK